MARANIDDVLRRDPNLAHELAYLKAKPTFTDEEKELLEELSNADSEEERQAVLQKLDTLGTQNALLIIKDDEIDRSINYEDEANKIEEYESRERLWLISSNIRMLNLEDLAKVEEMVAQAKAAGGFVYADDEN